MILIDYVDQIRREPPTPEERARMDEVYQELKRLSNEIKFPVITIKVIKREKFNEAPIFFLG